jgi:hypothetical protein
VHIAEWNQMAVRALLADAVRTLAVPGAEKARGNREIVRNTLADARKNYLDLVRRGRPLIMSDVEQVTFQKTLDHLTALFSCR